MRFKLAILLFTFALLSSCGSSNEPSYNYPDTSSLPNSPEWVNFQFTPEIMINLPDFPKRNQYEDMTEFAYKGNQYYSAVFFHTPLDPETQHGKVMRGRYTKYPSTILYQETKEINGIKGTEIIYEFEPYKLQGQAMPEIRHEFIYNHMDFTMLLCSWYHKKDEESGKINATRFIHSIEVKE